MIFFKSSISVIEKKVYRRFLDLIISQIKKKLDDKKVSFITLSRCPTKGGLFTHDWIIDRNYSCRLGELLITCGPSLHWRM